MARVLPLPSKLCHKLWDLKQRLSRALLFFFIKKKQKKQQQVLKSNKIASLSNKIASLGVLLL
jgi:hypothetical protein